MTTPSGTHIHGAGCGHLQIRHHDHIDFLQDGHLHHLRAGERIDHNIEVSAENPDGCHTLVCFQNHMNDPLVPHGDHEDHVWHGRLHHPHGDHCDDHGAIEMIQ